MVSQNTCIGEKLEDLEAQLGRSCTFRVMDLKFTLKPAQNAKFAVDHTLRWNNSNLITNWETILALNNYTGEMNSEIISKIQVPRLN